MLQNIEGELSTEITSTSTALTTEVKYVPDERPKAKKPWYAPSSKEIQESSIKSFKEQAAHFDFLINEDLLKLLTANNFSHVNNSFDIDTPFNYSQETILFLLKCYRVQVYITLYSNDESFKKFSDEITISFNSYPITKILLISYSLNFPIRIELWH